VGSLIHFLSCGLLISQIIFGLVACDSMENLPNVDLSDRLSDDEVRQLTPKQHQLNTYTFAFELRNNPLEDIRQYLPLLRYLHNKTGYNFDIQIAADINTLNQSLQNNNIDFLATGGMNFLNLTSQYQIIPLVRGVNIKGQSRYRSVIVVPFNSPIHSIKQLKDKRFAFGHMYSTQGHLIPRMMLLKHGISLEQLGFYKYTESHRNCAEAVISQRFDACGMQDTLAQSLAEQGLLRILATSKNYPSSGIFATPNAPVNVRKKVRQALLDFDPQGKDKTSL